MKDDDQKDKALVTPILNVIPPQPMLQMEDEYYQTNNQPQVKFKKLPLAVIPGLLMAANIHYSRFIGIPILQYLFISILLSFLMNYYLLRRYQLMPFLKIDRYDNMLKIACLLTFISIILSIYWGWNGSGGIIIAVIWEAAYGDTLGVLIYGYIAVIVGSVLLEGNFQYTKLLELIPGVLLGFVNSTLYTLTESNPYSIYHQFSLLCSIFLPVFFPLQQMVKPDLHQWLFLIVGGVLIWVTAIFAIRMMQKVRVSISMTCQNAILTLLTTAFVSTISFVEGALVLGGLVFILYKEYSRSEDQL